MTIVARRRRRGPRATARATATATARATATAEHGPIAVVVAAVQPATSTATILVSGPTEAIRAVAADSGRYVARVLGRELDRVLRGHGVTFVQWATDPIEGGGDSDLTSRWATGLGLRWMGNLGYWSADFGATGMGQPGRTGNRSGPGGLATGGDFHVSEDLNGFEQDRRLRLVPVDWSSGDPLARLVAIVERTYEGTLDCPDLCRFRTAREIVDGYCHAPAFDPRHGF